MTEQTANGSADAHFILMPGRGFRFSEELDAPAVQALFARHLPSGAQPPTIVAKVARSGPLLVSVHPRAAENTRKERDDIRLVPLRHYRPSWLRRSATAAPPTQAKHPVALRVLSSADQAPVANASVAAVADLNTGQGLAGATDAQGRVTLELSDPQQRFKAFFVTPQSTYWSYLAQDVLLTDGMDVPLMPIDLGFVDALRHFYGLPKEGDGKGVKVGIIDTGVGPHPDLVVAGGRNTVQGEDPSSYGDNGLGHGTHVAGIVAARGTPPHGVRGVAPGVSLFSYRVYAEGRGTSSSFAIIAAIEQGITDGCDFLNLSLDLDEKDDDAVHVAIAEANANGVVLLASAGNTTFGPRGAVAYPAADPGTLAVSAMGRKGTFPKGTLEVGETAAPFGTDPENFLARFSNAGPQVDLTGPGVGIISTFPGGYAAEDGTSMACPAACGRGAALLAAHPEILGMPRNKARNQAVAALLEGEARGLGLGKDFEGHGLP